MINFMKVNKSEFKNTWKLKVRPDQVAYVCEDLEDFVLSWSNESEIECYLISNGSVPIGFLAIDLSYKRHRQYVEDLNGFGVLRCFFIDEKFQGMGFSKAAINALIKWLPTKYPNLTKLFLTVNFKNELAKKTYLASGFRIFGQPYLGGAAGPQHVMIKNI